MRRWYRVTAYVARDGCEWVEPGAEYKGEPCVDPDARDAPAVRIYSDDGTRSCVLGADAVEAVGGWRVPALRAVTDAAGVVWVCQTDDRAPTPAAGADATAVVCDAGVRAVVILCPADWMTALPDAEIVRRIEDRVRAGARIAPAVPGE